MEAVMRIYKIRGGAETVPKWRKLFPRGWRPVKMHTNEHPVPQTINKMQVVDSKLCKRAERGCNLSKRFMSRGGAATPPLALAEIATSLSSFAQFVANHMILPMVCRRKCSFVCIFTGRHWDEFPPLGNSFLTLL